MSVRPLTWTKLGNGAWSETHSGTGPFRAILKGKELSTDSELTHVYENATTYATAPPDIEVLDTDAGDTSVGETNPPFAVLIWRCNSLADYYNVYKYIASVYTLIGTVLEDGRGYYRWEGDAVNVPTTEYYQVTTVDSEGEESDPIQFEIFVAGIPGRPTQSFSYDSGTGDVTVTASIS